MTGQDAEFSAASRDRLVDLLREHFAAGQFDVSEFGRRVEILLTAATAEQATAAVEDLPPLTNAAREPQRPWWRRLVGGRYNQADAARAGWLPTSERFRDPSSGVLIRVWVDSSDLSRRHYVRDEPG